MAKADTRSPALEVKDLNVFYGRSHALQGVNLTLRQGIMSVVGRNGMGKTTLCKAIVGLLRPSSGAVSFHGRHLTGLGLAEIARAGVGYVPQGRRLWRSLTVDEHLRLVARKGGAWTPERVYSVFPRLAERKGNGGAQLSGGEQQMLAIGRALLTNPRLLLMDEPTEGLAPVIVAQVVEMLTRLGEEGHVDILVIEQNIGVACAIAQDVAIMVNGRINRIVDAGSLAADRDLQQSLLGVGRHAHDESAPSVETAASPPLATRIYVSNPTAPTRWSPAISAALIEGAARSTTPVLTVDQGRARPAQLRRSPSGKVVYVCGTLDSKGDELRFMRDIVKGQGLSTRLVDLSTSGKPSGAEVPPYLVAAFHPRGAAGVFTGDRGTALAGMSLAFEAWMRQQTDVAGLLAAGGPGGTALVASAFRIPVLGVPKMIVSTAASDDIGRHLGPTDVMVMYSVADLRGINAISRAVLGNAANAIAGMVKARQAAPDIVAVRRTAGLTTSDITAPCVEAINAALKGEYDCLVFPASGMGGRSMEKLVEQGLVDHVVDTTMTDLCDMVSGGVFPADETRLDAIIRAGKPYIGAAGAIDVVNFQARETVPKRHDGRLFYQDSPQTTLMRTTIAENAAMARFLGDKLNRMTAPVRFFLPKGGVSMLDAPGRPFWNPEADEAFFRTLENVVQRTPSRQVIRLQENINDPAFAEHLVRAFRAFAQANTARTGA